MTQNRSLERPSNDLPGAHDRRLRHDAALQAGVGSHGPCASTGSGSGRTAGHGGCTGRTPGDPDLPACARIGRPAVRIPGETLTRELILRCRIKPPELQLEVLSRAGRHRLDFAWKEEKVALEFDGKTKYFDYKPTAEVLFEERRREKALTEEGWSFVRVEWKDLFREQEFKSRLLRALASRPGR